MQQSVAWFASIMHKFKQAQVPGQLLLGNTPMRAQPGPEAFNHVDMYCVKSSAIFIAGILTRPMMDRFMQIAPGGNWTTAQIGSAYGRSSPAALVSTTRTLFVASRGQELPSNLRSRYTLGKERSEILNQRFGLLSKVSDIW